ncbi:MAG: DNA methyltransferase [Candidatus Hodarchaeota archaeon]
MNLNLLGHPVKEVNFREIVKEIKARQHYTQEIHSYPGKLIHHIPNYFISRFSEKGDTVLDTFCGTGTVLAEARLNSRNSYGIEINPLSCLISRVKTTPLDTIKLRNESIKLFYEFEKLDGNIAFHKFPNIYFWFDRERINGLSKFLHLLNFIEDKKFKEFFQVCLSSIIRKVSYADPRISPAVKSKKRLESIEHYGLPSVMESFKEAVNLNIERIEKFSRKCDWNCFVEIKESDAREIKLENNRIDLVITSPPYINAQKYIRSTKLEIFWLGLLNEDEITKLDSDLVGTEKVFAESYNFLHNTGYNLADQIISTIYNKDHRRAYIAYKFYVDMNKVFGEIFRVLKEEKYFVLIIGNNTIKGINVPNQEILAEIAINNGFTIEHVFIDYIKSYGLMTKRNKTANMIDKEWVIVFRK